MFRVLRVSETGDVQYRVLFDRDRTDKTIPEEELLPPTPELIDAIYFCLGFQLEWHKREGEWVPLEFNLQALCGPYFEKGKKIAAQR